MRVVRASLRADPEVLGSARRRRARSAAAPVRKLLSSPAIQFKGSGLYITDYAEEVTSAGRPSQGGRVEGRAADSVVSDIDAKSDSSSSKPTRSRPTRPSKTKPSASSAGTSGRLAYSRSMPRRYCAELRPRGPGGAARSRRPPSGTPACCRCRGGRRRSRSHRSAASSAAGAGRWSAGSRPCGRCSVASSAGKMSGVRM